MKLPELTALLEYQNTRAMKLYEQNYPNNKLPAQQAFQETLKYIWLTTKHSLEKAAKPTDPDLPDRCLMLRSMREIDEMWHEFILFTQDYTDFCEHYFGGYVHHLPNVFDNMPVPREVMEREVEALLPYVYDNLGEETMRVWFAYYLEK